MWHVLLLNNRFLYIIHLLFDAYYGWLFKMGNAHKLCPFFFNLHGNLESKLTIKKAQLTSTIIRVTALLLMTIWGDCSKRFSSTQPYGYQALWWWRRTPADQLKPGCGIEVVSGGNKFHDGSLLHERMFKVSD